MKIAGIVIQQSKCETKAIPAATEVSNPYALGTTIVLSPKGMASEQTIQTARSRLTGTKKINTIAKRGINISLISDTK